MRAFNVSVIGAAIALATCGIASAGGPPKLDVRQSCSAAARGSVAPGTGTQACLNDEGTAQDALVRQWSDFSPAARAQCVGMNRTGRPSSCGELLARLGTMRDAARSQQK